MLSLEEGIAIDGIFKTRKWSRSKEMVFGHSILRVFTGRIFSSCHSENLNGFELIHWAMPLKKKGSVKLSCSQSCFWGPHQKRHLRTSRFECVFVKKKKSLDKSSQEPIMFPEFPWVPPPGPYSQLTVGTWWGAVSPTPKDRGEPPKQLYCSKGPGL